jgi:hypothetical protein
MTDNISKMYDVLTSGKAPAQTSKPIFAKDLELAKACGARSLKDIFGRKLNDNEEKGVSVPLNFGSRKSTGLLPDETRMRLFLLKQALSNVEIQAQYKYKTMLPSKEQMKSVPEFKNCLEPMLKAFDIASWDTWIDEVQARFYFEEYELPLMLPDEFDQLPMDSSIVRVPGALGKLYGLLETDDATFTGQSNTKSSYTVESKNNVCHAVITQDLLDDSSPAIIDKLRKEVVAGIKRSLDRSILDGDTTA